MLLLKDGVKYLPYDYGSEEELAQIVVEHHEEIFGRNSLYFDPQTMKSELGLEARNDGIIITPHQNKWYILEVELAKHPLHKHIIPQITEFSIAYEEAETRKKIIDTLYKAIRQDPARTAIIKAQNEDPHKMLADLIDIQPTIAIIIDQKKPDLDRICKKLPFPTQTMEFKTYIREKVGMGVHIHEFQSLFEMATKERGRIKCNVCGAIAPVGTRKKHFMDKHASSLGKGEKFDVKKWFTVPSEIEPSLPPTSPPRKIQLKSFSTKVLEVIELVFKGARLNESFREVAKRHGVQESTVRDKCTRRLGIDTEQFRRMIEDRTIITFLKERHPQYENLINEKLR